MSATTATKQLVPEQLFIRTTLQALPATIRALYK